MSDQATVNRLAERIASDLDALDDLYQKHSHGDVGVQLHALAQKRDLYALLLGAGIGGLGTRAASQEARP